MAYSRRMSQEQELMLVEFMEAHPLLARGSIDQTPPLTVVEKRQLWKELAALLNRQGPAFKTADGWRHLWHVLCSRRRADAARLKAERGDTGGGTLRGLAGRIVALIGTVTVTGFGPKLSALRSQQGDLQPVASRNQPVTSSSKPVASRFRASVGDQADTDGVVLNPSPAAEECRRLESSDEQDDASPAAPTPQPSPRRSSSCRTSGRSSKRRHHGSGEVMAQRRLHEMERIADLLEARNREDAAFHRRMEEKMDRFAHETREGMRELAAAIRVPAEQHKLLVDAIGVLTGILQNQVQTTPSH